ncbi:uncharacterized protein LOC107263389 isoform X2 [Cephus cinctus]|uniref:Uncharacterized protein LOC107263389 isoform X2 n=1 Tax=Cephus cinctus TaxID=211228 RepID=A0AAJ7R9S7_CEPCN|nr:uncharacterized protein LOC107263389 isoform X2 [Cephus cinctus]
MFHFPEPEPLDYYIDDVSPSFLTDGVLLRGKLEPVHKCVGKQLRPIKRKPSDPVGPIRKVDSCTLERWANKERSGYVNKCGENAWAVHDMMKLFPVRKFDSRKSQSSRVSIFPRSKQYEYDYTRDGRMCNSELGNEENLKCIKIEESPNYETKTKHDYTEKCVKSNISEKVQMEDKKCSVPDPLIKSEIVGSVALEILLNVNCLTHNMYSITGRIRCEMGLIEWMIGRLKSGKKKIRETSHMPVNGYLVNMERHCCVT